MLSLEQAAAFGLASVLLTLIPGPTVLFVVGRSLSLGRRAGLLSVLGNTLGLLPIVLAVALGIGTLVAESVVVFTVVKFVGAAYLVYLGVQAVRTRGGAVTADLDRRAAQQPAHRPRRLHGRRDQPEVAGLPGRGAAAVRRPLGRQHPGAAVPARHRSS